VEKLETLAFDQQLPIAKMIAEAQALPLSGKAKVGIESFQRYLRYGFDALEKGDSLVDLFVEGMRIIRYVEALESEKTEENLERIQNIKEFFSAVQEFEETWRPNAETQGSKDSLVKQKLRDFLERVSLMADIDRM